MEHNDSSREEQGSAMLTDAEQRVLDLTVELVKEFCALPEEHSSDKPEFVMAIHRIQDMVLSRPARRTLLR